MHIKFVIVLLVSGIFLMSCSACKNNSSQESEKLGKINERDVNLAKKLKLPPGTVKVRTLINSIKIESPELIIVEIDGVLGYGQAAPVVSESDKLKIKVSETISRSILDNDTSINMLIKHSRGGRGEENSNIWNLISIEK